MKNKSVFHENMKNKHLEISGIKKKKKNKKNLKLRNNTKKKKHTSIFVPNMNLLFANY